MTPRIQVGTLLIEDRPLVTRILFPEGGQHDRVKEAGMAPGTTTLSL